MKRKKMNEGDKRMQPLRTPKKKEKKPEWSFKQHCGPLKHYPPSSSSSSSSRNARSYTPLH